MRCPKCGAFMEQGKDTCLMCGTNAKTYVPESNPNAIFSNNNSSAFGSGNDFRQGMQTGAFQNGGNMNGGFTGYTPKAPFTPAPIKKEDKDIFDFYEENKGLFNTIVVFVVFGLIALSGYFYYNSRIKEVKIEPKYQNLYFEVDESFSQQNGNNGGVSFAKTGSAGSDCMISITSGSSTSGNHVQDFFTQSKGLIEPAKDSSNQVIDVLEIYTPSETDSVINGSTWYGLNIFYKESEKGNPTILKNRYLTSMDKGMYYDIVLTNFNNDPVCNASLNNFAKSLKFINQ